MKDFELPSLVELPSIAKATRLRYRPPSLLHRRISTMGVQDIDEEAAKTDPDPTELQRKAGNYRHGHITWHGLNISIETARGQVRRGTDSSGKPWSVTMPAHYGFIRGTVGKDHDPLDVFIGPHPESEIVFVIDQKSPRDGQFDEHKVMIGYRSVTEARLAYELAYTPGWKGFMAITPMTVGQFKDWRHHASLKRPASSYVSFQPGARLVKKSVNPPSLQKAIDKVGGKHNLGLDLSGHTVVFVAPKSARLAPDYDVEHWKLGGHPDFPAHKHQVLSEVRDYLMDRGYQPVYLKKEKRYKEPIFHHTFRNKSTGGVIHTGSSHLTLADPEGGVLRVGITNDHPSLGYDHPQRLMYEVSHSTRQDNEAGFRANRRYISGHASARDVAQAADAWKNNIASPLFKAVGDGDFNDWFHGSHVTDEHGEPLTVYHGTGGVGSSFDTFQHGVKRSTRGLDAGKDAFYFTPSRDAAELYSTLADKRHGSPRVIDAHLSLKNPKIYRNWEDAASADVLSLKHDGHDGFIRYYDGADSDHHSNIAEIAVFHPDQIRSASPESGLAKALWPFGLGRREEPASKMVDRMDMLEHIADQKEFAAWVHPSGAIEQVRHHQHHAATEGYQNVDDYQRHTGKLRIHYAPYSFGAVVSHVHGMTPAQARVAEGMLDMAKAQGKHTALEYRHGGAGRPVMLTGETKVPGSWIGDAGMAKAVDRRGGSQNLGFDFGEGSGSEPSPKPAPKGVDAPLAELPKLHNLAVGHTPDLTKYHMILVNTSGGKDSQAMLHHVAQLAKKAGVLDRVHAVHADLGRVEWKGTKEVAKAQADHYGIPFHVVTNPHRDLLQQVEERGMWPSNKQRYCTSDHKRAQIDKLITSMHSDHVASARAKGETPEKFRVLNCMGLRAAESPARAKKNPIDYGETLRQNKKGEEVQGRLTTKSRTVDHWLPIHDWSHERVWSTIKRAGTPVHHAYHLGMPRLSCAFCVFASKPALMLAGKHNPELLQQYVDTERKIGHSFRSDLKIADVQDALKRGEEPGPIKTWEM